MANESKRQSRAGGTKMAALAAAAQAAGVAHPHAVGYLATQGDILVRRVKSIPKSATPKEAVGGKHIVAHSETGHHHWVAADEVKMFEEPKNPRICYLSIGSVGGGVLTHARDYDTHAPLALGKGDWEIRRQREMTPDGWKQVQD